MPATPAVPSAPAAAGSPDLAPEAVRQPADRAVASAPKHGRPANPATAADGILRPAVTSAATLAATPAAAPALTPAGASSPDGSPGTDGRPQRDEQAEPLEEEQAGSNQRPRVCPDGPPQASDCDDEGPGNGERPGGGKHPGGERGWWSGASGLSGGGPDPVAIPDGLAVMTPGAELSALLSQIALPAISGFDTVEVLKARYRQLCHERAAFLETILEVSLREPFSKESISRLEVPDEFAPDEARAALVWSRRRSDSTFALAWDVHRRLPMLGEAMYAGDLDEPRARAFISWTRGLTGDQAAFICHTLLPKAPGRTVGELIDEIRRHAIAIDPDWAARRYREAVRQRAVVGIRNEDGTATVSGVNLPLDRAAAGCERIDRLAAACKRAGDKRRPHLIKADLFMGFLDGAFEGMGDDQVIAHVLAHPFTDPNDTPDPGDPDHDRSPNDTPDPGDPDHDRSPNDTPDPSDPDPAPDPDGPPGPGIDDTSGPGQGEGTDSGGPDPGPDGGLQPGEPTPEHPGPDACHAPGPDDCPASGPAAHHLGSNEPQSDGHGPELRERIDPQHSGPRSGGDADKHPETGGPGDFEPRSPGPDTGPDPLGGSPDSGSAPNHRECGDHGHHGPGDGPKSGTSPDPCDGPGPNRGADPTGATPGSGDGPYPGSEADPGGTAQQREAGARPGLGAGGELAGRSWAAAELRVKLTTLLGWDEHPAEVPGWGVIHAGLARHMAASMHPAEWRFVVCGDDLRAMFAGVTRHRPTTAHAQPGRATSMTTGMGTGTGAGTEAGTGAATGAGAGSMRGTRGGAERDTRRGGVVEFQITRTDLLRLADLMRAAGLMPGAHPSSSAPPGPRNGSRGPDDDGNVSRGAPTSGREPGMGQHSSLAAQSATDRKPDIAHQPVRNSGTARTGPPHGSEQRAANSGLVDGAACSPALAAWAVVITDLARQLFAYEHAPDKAHETTSTTIPSRGVAIGAAPTNGDRTVEAAVEATDDATEAVAPAIANGEANSKADDKTAARWPAQDDWTRDADRRRAGAALRRWVQIRGRVCSGVGCRMPAMKADQDHITDWILGGATTDANLHPVCRHDHRARHEGKWRITSPKPGLIVWHSPLGHDYPVKPPPVISRLPTPQPRNWPHVPCQFDPYGDDGDEPTMPAPPAASGPANSWSANIDGEPLPTSEETDVCPF